MAQEASGEDLYSLVTKNTQTDSKDTPNVSQKVQFGYSVDQYKGVLAALKQVQANVGGGGGNVMGDDLSKLSNLRFDNNDFSENAKAAIWRMDIGLFGALPIYYVGYQKHGIVRTDNYDPSSIASSANNRTIPYELVETNLQGTWERGEAFQNGVYVDVDTKLVKYFNKFFVGTSTVGTFNANIVWQLLHKRCLRAQIIPDDGVGECEALVIGKAPLKNSSRIFISPSMFASSSMKNLNMNIQLSGGGKSLTILPESSDSGNFRCEVKDAQYTLKDGSIKGFDVNAWEKWLKNSIVGTDGAEAFSIMQPSPRKIYVRIYIPFDKRQEATAILPQGTSEAIFNTYSAVRGGAGNIPAGLSADVTRMMECITEACNKFGCKLYTKADVVDRTGSPGAMGQNPSWVSSKGGGQKGAMTGFFYIPQGWPMSTINQNYGGRSVSNQRSRGHPEQQNSDVLQPWVVPDQEGRLDSALSGRLSSTICSGAMPREWYQERLTKSNLGNIKIYCNKAVANQFQELFNRSWDVYAEAANIYNSGRRAEEQVSAGEILLRCAPCICAINGGSGVHRARSGRSAGHDAGCAIDFDPANNGTTSSKETNCNSMEIGRNMEVGYRPFLHYLIALGGGWGGSYKFCSGKFDAMHIQF